MDDLIESAKRACLTCEYFVRKPPAKGDQLPHPTDKLYCYRYPNATRVEIDHWCGEHKLKYNEDDYIGVE